MESSFVMVFSLMIKEYIIEISSENTVRVEVPLNESENEFLSSILVAAQCKL